MNKLLAEPIRFSKLALACCLIGHSAIAMEVNIHKATPEDKQIAEQAKAMAEAAGKSGMLDEGWMIQAQKNVQDARGQAMELYQELTRTNPTIQHAKSMQQAKLADTNYDTLIFVSNSLGDEAITEILASASGQPGTAVVLRGIAEGTTIGQGVLAMQKIAIQFDPVPNLILDPSLFIKHNVTMVPTIVALGTKSEDKEQIMPPVENAQNGSVLDIQGSESREIARVEGLYDPAWLTRQIDAGLKGNLGVRGPITEIAEQDIIDVMKERVLAIDWHARREQAKERYWQNRTFIDLPRAPKARTKLVDASVVATADIQASDGQFVARAGDTVNPLASRPFTQAIVVFDPTDQEQMEMLREAVPQIEKEPNVARIIYIATRIDQDKGWDGYEALTTSMQAPVYLLTSDVRNRFELEHTPSIVTANNTHFVIRELAKREVKTEQ